MSHSVESDQLNDIAIVGMACHFPGAKSVDEFWQNLRDGVECVYFFSDQELEAAGVDPVVLRNPDYVKAKPVLEDIGMLDALFFKISPREAAMMDPQHRLFLECAWEVLESAGCNPETYEGHIGVYAGVDRDDYLLSNLFLDLDSMAASSSGLQYLVENDKDYLSTRVSYKLNLRGPSITIQTACSTSLVAVHLACESLLTGECDMALAGGVSVSVPQRTGYLYEEEGILSPDGHCRAFDASAKGTVFGSGVGVVVLKRLADALADGDPIQVVIKGSAINNDGSLKVGYIAPSVEGQAAVIAEALDVAGVDPETITYIEAHGTGTELGDPVEIAALTKAFRLSTAKQGFCAIGSVKTNVGHLQTAGGAASLIKTVLALKHKMIPPSLNFEHPNPKIDFANSPFYVNAELLEWKTDGHPRRAGVSAFGMGGTNAHVILEEAPKVEPSGPTRGDQLVLLSAKTESALEMATSNLVTHLRENTTLSLADVAYTLQVGRAAFNWRRMVVCHDLEDGAEALAMTDPHRVFTTHQELRDRPVVFLFPGVGDHYVGMGQDLYRTEPIFREWVDRCCTLLEPDLQCDLRERLYPAGEDVVPLGGQGINLREMMGRQTDEVDGSSQGSLLQTMLAQPVVFVVEYALAQLLMAWGIQPKAMIGYSLGEYVAACLSGVISLKDALKLVAGRAELIQSLEAGAMVTVPLSEAEVQPFLNKEASLTGVLTPTLSVMAGSPKAIAAVVEELRVRDIACRRLPTTHAFHSPMMVPIREAFGRLVQSVTLNSPAIPYLSNVTGDWITSEEATDPGYWTRHLCQTVQFSSGIGKLLERQDQVLLEVGPGQSLGTFVRQHPDCDVDQASRVLPTMRYAYDKQQDGAFLLKTLGKLWLAGATIDWHGFYRYEHRRRLPLPTYPFEREYYWLEPSKGYLQGQIAVRQVHARSEGASALPRQELSDWFYLPTWKQVAPQLPQWPTEETNEAMCWLLFADTLGLAGQVEAWLTKHNQRVVSVLPGSAFEKRGENQFSVRPRSAADYTTLLDELRRQGLEPTRIVHMWNVTPAASVPSSNVSLDTILDLGLHSLVCLAQAIGGLELASCKVSVVASQLQAVTVDERPCPEKATLIGPCRVIPLEYENIMCRCVDVALPAPGSWQEEALLMNLLSELITGATDDFVALRGHQRWVESFEPIRLLPVSEGESSLLRPGGVYMVTGGLGGIGLALAEHLARTAQAKLILLNRSGLPPRSEWDLRLEAEGDEGRIERRIRQVQQLESLGAEVLVLVADVADEVQVCAAVEQAVAQFGTINGVIHAAGVPGMGLIQLKTPEMTAEVLAPKVQGTRVLERVLQGIELDFFVLFSSITSLTGGAPGQVDYCAASAFMDAYAQYQRRWLTISINWSEWQWNAWEQGLAGFSQEFQAFLRENRKRFGIMFEEGNDALERILSHYLPRVVVSTQDFCQLAEMSGSLTAANILDWRREVSSTQPRHPRPVMGVSYVAPSSELERKIAATWGDVLGISEIGTNDNFFELGGHSLIAVQVIAQLRRMFQVNLSLAQMWAAPTVAELAIAVELAIIDELEGRVESDA